MHDGARREHAQETIDVISDRLMIAQHARGYRFGLDSLLLATDLPGLPEEPVIWELGIAQGAVLWSVLARLVRARGVGVERQESLAALARANIARNAQWLHPTERATVLCADVREHRDRFEPHSADLVLINPPYFEQGARRLGHNAQKSQAHHEFHGGLADFIDAATYVMRHRAWLKIIAPPRRLPHLFEAVASKPDLHVISLRSVHADPDADAYLVEAILRRGKRPDMVMRPTLCVRTHEGHYTDEIAHRLAGAARPDPPPPEIVERMRASSRTT